MNVTITINNNTKYCAQHKLVTEDVYPCQSCSIAERVVPDCGECGGRGMVSFARLPFELNIANRNFATLWSALGLDPSNYCGSIDGRKMQQALANCWAGLIVRSPSKGGIRVQFIDGGISHDQAMSYIQRLEEIAKAAESREERIVWG